MMSNFKGRIAKWLKPRSSCGEEMILVEGSDGYTKHEDLIQDTEAI